MVSKLYYLYIRKHRGQFVNKNKVLLLATPLNGSVQKPLLIEFRQSSDPCPNRLKQIQTLIFAIGHASYKQIPVRNLYFVNLIYDSFCMLKISTY